MLLCGTSQLSSICAKASFSVKAEPSRFAKSVEIIYFIPERELGRRFLMPSKKEKYMRQTIIVFMIGIIEAVKPTILEGNTLLKIVILK